MVLEQSANRRVGAKLALLLSLLLLTGCTTKVVKQNVPYVRLESGEIATATTVFTMHGARARTAKDSQPLYFCTDWGDSVLEQRNLIQYEGSLYSLSNYRQALLDNGWVEDSLVQTSDLLDSMLVRDNDRVRLIYQSTGMIRILFDNPQGAAHILLEGMR